MIEGMKAIGEEELCGGDREQGGMLKEPLDTILRVRWSLVDPRWVFHLREN